MEKEYFKEIRFFCMGGLFQLLWLTLKLHNRSEHQGLPEIECLFKCVQKASVIMESCSTPLFMSVFRNPNLGEYTTRHLALMFIRVCQFFKNRKTRSNNWRFPFSGYPNRSDSDLVSSLSMSASSFYHNQSYYGYLNPREHWLMNRFRRVVNGVKGAFGFAAKRGSFLDTSGQSWIGTRILKERVGKNFLNKKFRNQLLRDQFVSDLGLIAQVWGIGNERVAEILKESNEYLKEKKMKGGQFDYLFKFAWFEIMIFMNA